MPGKILELTFFRQPTVVGQNDSAPRSPQGFVGCAGDQMGVRQGVGVESGCDQTRYMGHVHQEEGIDGIGDLS